MSLVQGLENGSIRPGWSKAKRRHRRRHAAALGTTLVSPLPTQTEPRSRISRRAFLATSATAGGALVLGLTLHRSFRLKPNGEDPFDTWIRIHPDGQIQLVVNKSEMGQGVYTALPMILAEEAEIDWQQITVLQSENSVGTGGSSSVHKSYQPLRQAGAVVRETMIAAAARRWEVPSADGALVVLRSSGKAGPETAATGCKQRPPERPQRFHAARTLYPAPRYSRQSEGENLLRHRCAPSGYGLRGGGAVPVLKRKTDSL
jgi:hypothetical protein